MNCRFPQTRARCVCLTPTIGAYRPRLRVVAPVERWRIQETDHPAMAMTELCLAEREQCMRSAWGLQRHEALVLLVVHPAGWPGIDGLFGSVKNHLPHTFVYGLEEDRLVQLDGPTDDLLRESAKAARQDLSSTEAMEAPVFVRPRDLTDRDLHLTGPSSDCDSPREPSSRTAARVRAEVTPEEIAMLLDSDAEGGAT